MTSSRSVLIVALTACAPPSAKELSSPATAGDGLHHHFLQANSNRAIVLGGSAPQNMWSPVTVVENAECLYPLDVAHNNWRIESVRVFLAGTPRGAPTYSLAATRFDENSGVSGYETLEFSKVTTTDIVIDLPQKALSMQFDAPLFLRVEASDSSTIIGVIDIGYEEQQ